MHNFIRGLSPYPTAWTEVKKENEVLSLKIFRTSKEISEHQNDFGTVLTDGKTFAKVAVKGGFVHLLDLQLAGRKKMNVEEFLRGFSFESWKINL